MKKRRGQILIIVLLMVVVALAVGLSVASRNLANLKTSTQTEQSQRAFTAAEGGVESVLSNLSVGSSTVPVGDLTASVTVQQTNVYEQVVEEGNVGQIDLTGVSSGQGVKIEWAKSSDSSESANSASLELTVIYGPNSGNYTQERFAWQGSTHGADEVGFSNPATTCIPSGFEKCGKLTLSSTPKILRIRPFWNKVTVKVQGDGFNLPAQTYNITSTATTPQGLTRKLQVTKSALPQLPATFDYVLYSENSIAK